MQSPAPHQNIDTPPKSIKTPGRQSRSRKSDTGRPSGSVTRKSKPRQKVTEALFFSVRDILEERSQNGVEGYVIDWADGPNGEKYSPTWEPKSFVNEAAIQAWEARKQATAQLDQSQVDSRKAPTQSSQESEPVRPAKRKRDLSKVSPNGPPDISPTHSPKRSKITLKFSRKSLNSQLRHTVEGREEIEDSYEDKEVSNSERTTGIRVEVPINEHFDRDAYVTISSSALQSTASTLPDIKSPASARSHPQNVAESTILSHEGGVVPDSQDLPGSSQHNNSDLVATGTPSPSRLPATVETESQESTQTQDIAVSSTEGSRPKSRGIPIASLVDTSSSSSLNDNFGNKTSQCSSSRENLPPNPSIVSLSTPVLSAKRTVPVIPNQPLNQKVLSESPRTDDLQFQTQAPYLRDNSIIEDDVLNSLLGEDDEIKLQHEVSSPKSVQPQVESADRLRINTGHSVAFKELDSPEAKQTGQVLNHNDESSPGTARRESFNIFEERLASVARRNPFSQDLSQKSSEQSVLSQTDANSQRPSSQHTDFVSPTRNTIDPDKRASLLPFGTIENLIPTIETAESPEKYSSSILVRPPTPLSAFPQISDTYQLNQVSRPKAPSTDNMSGDQHIERSRPLSVADMLIGSTSGAADRETRSPSVIPPKRPSSPLHVPNQMLPVREPVTSATSGENVLADFPSSVPNEELPASSTDYGLRLLTGPMEFVVMLPMMSIVRDIYQKALYDRRHEIQKYLNGDELDSSLTAQMDSIIHYLKLLTDHQDLTDEMSSTQAAFTDDVQSKWAETCSAKFSFLRELLDQLRSSEIHVAVLARPGKMLDILEALLRANNFPYDRPDRPGRSFESASGRLKVTLLPTGLDDSAYIVHRVDAVIAFDNTFHISERYSKILRANLYEPMRPSPLISLVVTHSPEHFELCLPKTMDPLERKLQLVSLITQTRHEVGVLDPEVPRPDQAAPTVAQYLSSSLYSTVPPEWPLPQDVYVSGVQMSKYGPRPQQSDSTQSQDDPIASTGVSTPYSAAKRTFDDINEDSTKRMRMTPVPGDSTSSGDVTRVSESITFPSQRWPVTVDNVARRAIEEVKVIDQEQSDQVTSLLAKVAALEIQLQNKDQEKILLEDKVKDGETKIGEYSALVNRFQTMYQAALKQRAKAEAENEAAKTQATTAAQRLETRLTEIAKLKEEKANLQAELNTTHASLANSSVPEAAELSKAQDEIRSLKSSKEQWERKASSIQRDFDFTRDLYQKASTSGAELSNELMEAKEEITKLERKADENTVRIAEIQRSNEAKEREDRIEELEAQVREYQQELFKKNEELKAKTNGRRDTRGTSVPRSPRMGSGALSPRPYVARAGNGGSRGNSPAPGDQMREQQFRDPIVFPQRWTHLRDNM